MFIIYLYLVVVVNRNLVPSGVIVGQQSVISLVEKTSEKTSQCQQACQIR